MYEKHSRRMTMTNSISGKLAILIRTLSCKLLQQLLLIYHRYSKMLHLSRKPTTPYGQIWGKSIFSDHLCRKLSRISATSQDDFIISLTIHRRLGSRIPLNNYFRSSMVEFIKSFIFIVLSKMDTFGKNNFLSFRGISKLKRLQYKIFF